MSWQKEFKKNVKTLDELKQYLDILPEEEEELSQVIDIHPMSIPRYYLSLIDKNDPKDPIRRMAVPSADELDVAGSYDTSGEKENTKFPGLQHKYPTTVLLLSTNICSMYCRHCFRKRMVGLSNDEIVDRFNRAVEYIKAHEEVNNVLISGGDFLTLKTSIIDKLFGDITKIPHLDFIRFGSRMPVTFPDRILKDPELLKVLSKHSAKNKRLYMVTHFNHKNEITEKAMDGIDRVIRSGVIINNQTVLLKGVNDSPEALAELQNGLVRIGVNPYYIFQCRPVKRVKSNFQLPLIKGYRIVEKAKVNMNGHSKRFKFVMAHKTGKIEIIGAIGEELIFKYHQAKKPEDQGRIFKKKIRYSAGWLDEQPYC